jgi:MFS family permease
MLLAPTITWAIVGQLLAGAAAAIIVPSLVALIAENYRGAQQATAVGSLGSARAISGVSAFLIGGTLGTLVGWRPIFLITLALAVAVFALSFTLRADRGDPTIRIDLPASALIGGAVVALTLGFNNLNGWGVLLAEDTAPFSVLGLSPAPVLVVLGIMLGQLFLMRTRRRTEQGKVPLVDLRVLGDRQERSAVYAMFIIVSMEAAVNFTVPIYIQVVQGRTPLDTSLAMMPFNLTVFVTATLIVRFYSRFAPRTIALFSFVLTTLALVWLSLVVTNNWETLPTILGLVVVGIGQGALVLGAGIGRAVLEHPELPEELVAQVDLDQVNFVSNDELHEVLSRTTATEEQVDAAVALNEEQRLRTLKIGFLVLAGLSAVAALPASRLPAYRPEEIPDPQPEPAGD